MGLAQSGVKRVGSSVQFRALSGSVARIVSLARQVSSGGRDWQQSGGQFRAASNGSWAHSTKSALAPITMPSWAPDLVEGYGMDAPTLNGISVPKWMCRAAT